MRKRYFITAVVIFCYSILVVPSACSFSLGDRVHKYILRNGLTVLLMERHQSPTMSCYLRFRVGSVDEESGRTGTAHLLEHMLFKGTRTLGTNDYKTEKKILEQIDRAGEKLDAELRRGTVRQERIASLKKELARLETEARRFVVKDEIDSIYSRNGAIGLNASTGNDITTYQVSLPSNKSQLWARIDADRVANPVFREFYSERDVVLEEYRQSYESNPARLLMAQFLSAAFMVHPYRVPIIGWKSDVQFISKKDIEAFYSAYYVPNNAVLAVVGDIHSASLLKTIEQYFGGIPSRELPSRVISAEPEQTGERRIEVQLDAEPQVLIGYHKPTLPSFDDYVFDVIDALLSSGRTSRLYQALVLKNKLATSIETISGLPGARYPNLFALQAVPRPPHTCAEVVSGIYAELERLKYEPVSPHELQKVKNQLQAQFIKSLNSNEGLASQLSYFQIICDNWKYLEQHIDVIHKITAADVQRVARRYFVERNRTIAELVKTSSVKQLPGE
jgi:predicted Zn-dependent peptidase